MNVVFLYREQLVCLLVCLSVSEIYPKKESSKVKLKKMVYKKKLKPKTRKMKTMKIVQNVQSANEEWKWPHAVI